MHREVWDVCEKPWDAQGGLGCLGSTQDPWQGRVTWHTTSPQCHTVCAQGIVALGVTAVGSPGRAALGPAQ